MATDARGELLSFHQFLSEQLDAEELCLSPEEALDVWRTQHPTPEQYAANVQAVREALADMDAGDTGTPLEIFRTEFRKRHNIDCET